jgi:MoaA/NifB/PqqE/SkfB family radical SAM enzyme
LSGLVAKAGLAAQVQMQQYHHRLHVLPVVVVYLNNICDSRCGTCEIWKNNETVRVSAERQMSAALLEEIYESLRNWQPRQILISGGEPVLHPQFSHAVVRFAAIARDVGVITNGLKLGDCAGEALEKASAFYISFDAPDRATYAAIRGIDGFEKLARAPERLHRLASRPKIVARCTLQRGNIRRIPDLIARARRLGFDTISFLGVDVTSQAFSRDRHGASNISAIQPAAEDLAAMEETIDSSELMSEPFVEGGVARLKRILQYFRALLGEAEFPLVRCNAPWVSVVIETTGAIRGCFFQPVIGDFRSINGQAALDFRRNLDVKSNATCRRCVCSKWLSPRDLLL